MTNPKGRIFISYRRLEHRTHEAVRLRNALRDRGVPTWRDLDNLDSKPTEDELISVLSDYDTSGAVLLIAQEVEDSTMIRNVEAPRIFKRHHGQDGFIIKPVLIGVSYGAANDVLNAPAGFQNLGNWNLHKLDSDALTCDDARRVANDILRARLKQISEKYPGNPLELTISTRSVADPVFSALQFDFGSYFEGRVAHSNAYDKIETALKDAAQAVAETHGGAEIICDGYAALPMGVLFGSIFSPLRRFKINWAQGLAGHEKQNWSLSVDRSDISLVNRVAMGNTGSEDIVLAMGISANIEHAVTEFINTTNIDPRAFIFSHLPVGSVKQGQALTPEDGLSIVLQAVDKVRKLKDDLMLKRVNLHLFMACPLAMAVLIGQKLNTISKCSVYEHMPSSEISYQHAHTFCPSDF